MVEAWAVEMVSDILEASMQALLELAEEAPSGSNEQAFFTAMAVTQQVALTRWLPKAAEEAPGAPKIEA